MTRQKNAKLHQINKELENDMQKVQQQIQDATKATKK